ncbi:hypothetical protein E4U53_004761, partial [Claviceps sorghi]
RRSKTAVFREAAEVDCRQGERPRLSSGAPGISNVAQRSNGCCSPHNRNDGSSGSIPRMGLTAKQPGGFALSSRFATSESRGRPAATEAVAGTRTRRTASWQADWVVGAL